MEKYLLENVLSKIIKTDESGRLYVLEKDLDQLNLTSNEYKFIDLILAKYHIELKKDLTQRIDRSNRVSDFEYGTHIGTETLDRDVSVKADIEYSEYGHLVFENYQALDDFLEKVFIPDKVTLKKRIHSNDDKPYPFVTLNNIVKLRLSELENKHIIEYLNKNGISVRGKDPSLDGEFENYDYYQTFKNNILPKTLSNTEQAEKFRLYYATKDPVLREQLIIANMRLASYIAYKMNIAFGIDMHELESYAYEGLIEAIDRFNPSYNNKFSSFGYKYIKGYILTGIPEIEGFQKTSIAQGLLKAKRKVEAETGLSLKENPEIATDIIALMQKEGLIGQATAKDIPNLIAMTYHKEPLVGNEDLMESVDNLPEKVALSKDMEQKIFEVIDTLPQIEKRVIELRYGFVDGEPKTLKEISQEFNVNLERIRQIEAKALRHLRHPSRSRKIRAYSDSYQEREIVSKKEPTKTYVDEIIEKNMRR